MTENQGTLMAPSKPQLTHRVVRPFDGAGHIRGVGELIDATGWRRPDALVSMRYLAPLTVEEIQAEPYVDPVNGRLWVDAAAFARHVLYEAHQAEQDGGRQALAEETDPVVSPEPTLTAPFASYASHPEAPESPEPETDAPRRAPSIVDQLDLDHVSIDTYPED